jgi:hypothetical protein
LPKARSTQTTSKTTTTTTTTTTPKTTTTLSTSRIPTTFSDADDVAFLNSLVIYIETKI